MTPTLLTHGRGRKSDGNELDSVKGVVTQLDETRATQIGRLPEPTARVTVPLIARGVKGITTMTHFLSRWSLSIAICISVSNEYAWRKPASGGEIAIASEKRRA